MSTDKEKQPISITIEEKEIDVSGHVLGLKLDPINDEYVFVATVWYTVGAEMARYLAITRYHFHSDDSQQIWQGEFDIDASELRISDDLQWVLASGFHGLYVLRLQSPSPPILVDSRDVPCFAISKDSTFYVRGNEMSLEVWGLLTHDQIQRQICPASSVAVSAEPCWIVSGGNKRVCLWSRRLEPIWESNIQEDVFHVCISENAETVACASRGSVIVFLTNNGSISLIIPEPGVVPLGLVSSHAILLDNGNEVGIWDLKDISSVVHKILTDIIGISSNRVVYGRAHEDVFKIRMFEIKES